MKCARIVAINAKSNGELLMKNYIEFVKRPFFSMKNEAIHIYSGWLKSQSPQLFLD